MGARRVALAAFAMFATATASCWPGCSCGPDAVPVEPSSRMPQPAQQDRHSLPAQHAGPAIFADDLIGTAWYAGDLQLTFEAEGVVRVRDEREGGSKAPADPELGVWKLKGSQLVIRVGETEYVLEAYGPTIRYGGESLDRVGT